MSVYANTLNAYAGKLKAQRKAAERIAQAQARAKSSEQRQADKQRVEAERLQKQAEANALATPTDAVEVYLDLVLRKFKNDFNEVLVNGERARITQDLNTITELFYYQGHIPGNVAYKLIDATDYSKTAFTVLVSVLSTMKIVQSDGAFQVVAANLRRVMVMKNNNKMCAVSFLDIHQTVEEVKARFLTQIGDGVGMKVYFG